MFALICVFNFCCFLNIANLNSVVIYFNILFKATQCCHQQGMCSLLRNGFAHLKKIELKWLAKHVYIMKLTTKY